MRAVTTSRPAVRMLVLFADCWQNEAGEIEHTIKRLPVLSLESSIIHHYSRRDFDGEPDRSNYANEEEAASANYLFREEEVRHDFVVMYPESPIHEGEATTLGELRQHRCESDYYCLVACEWSRAEDDEQLKPFADALVAEATACIQRKVQQPIGEGTAS